MEQPSPLRGPGRLTGRQPSRLHLGPGDGWQLEQNARRLSSLRGLVRAALRAVAILIWTLFALPVQAVLLLVPGRAKIAFAQHYWSVISRLLGLKIRVLGTPAWQAGRAVAFVSNHSSWLDIPVLGGQLAACFVSKEEVARWPVVGTVARLGRTVFVSRNRQATGRERDEMRARLAAGDNLILFPEGTSSDGSRVLPFRSPFFAIGEGADPPLIQPVSLVYDRLAGLPMGRVNRPLFAWYGSMALAPHFWRLAQQTGCRATLLLHPAVDPALFPSRKRLAEEVWQSVAQGAALLRQNRPAPVAEPALDPGADLQVVDAQPVSA